MSERCSEVLSVHVPHRASSPDASCGTAAPHAGCSVRVIVAASSPTLLSGLECLLDAAAGIALRSSAGSREGLRAACSGGMACVALVDAALCLEDTREFVTALRESAPRARVLLIVDGSRPHLVREALRGGACGFITRTSGIDEIRDALMAASAGHRYITSSVTADLAECLTLQELTAREMEVLRVLARGKSNKVIARELAVTVGTIKTHVRSIMTKLDSHGRTDVLLKAHRLGFVRIA